jgi:hypothetical protein
VVEGDGKAVLGGRGVGVEWEEEKIAAVVEREDFLWTPKLSGGPPGLWSDP